MRSAGCTCLCASESAHRRRYEAVLEMQPSIYSMVWMAWWIITSAKSNSSAWYAVGLPFMSETSDEPSPSGSSIKRRDEPSSSGLSVLYPRSIR